MGVNTTISYWEQEGGGCHQWLKAIPMTRDSPVLWATRVGRSVNVK